MFNKFKFGIVAISAAAGTFLTSMVARAGQFDAATNQATAVVTDLTTDMLTLSGKLILLAAGLFIIFLVWRRSRRVANSETRVK